MLILFLYCLLCFYLRKGLHHEKQEHLHPYLDQSYDCGYLHSGSPFTPHPHFTSSNFSYQSCHLVYLFIGFAGMPVFSSFTAGPAKLLGPTGGYLIGFIFMALIAGFFVKKFPDRIYMYIVGMALGTVITYLLGTVWLAWQANLNLKSALFAGVIPYIPGDVIKIIVAAVFGTTIRKRIKKAGYLD